MLLAPQWFVTASNYGLAPDAPMASQSRVEADVTIGNDVWLGAGAIVVAGVTVGDGCVVGAGSVVTLALPPNSIAAGCPARVIRSRVVDGAHASAADE